MDFLQCVKGRRSIRKFKEEKIDHDKLERIVKIASFSPSWKNSQIARYNIIEDKNMINNIAENCVMSFEFNSNTINNATAIVVVTTVTGCSGYNKDGSFATSKKTHWESFDAGIATQTFCLAAHNEGVGSVIIGIFDEELVSTTLDIPKNEKVAALIAIGYADEEPIMPERKSVKELIRFK